MRVLLERTTGDQYIHDLVDSVKDETIHLFILKCIFTYPEYQHRIKTAKANAINEARVNRYSDAYSKAFVLHRIDLTVQEIYQDMKSAFEVLTAKLKFKQPEIFNTEPYIKLSRYVKTPPVFEVSDARTRNA